MRFDEVHDHVVVYFVIRFNDVPALERNERHVGPQLGLEGQGLGGHLIGRIRSTWFAATGGVQQR